ncbi:MAG: hypothetical protein MRY83_11090, partial [Flavobacteriales bacterium]|nr:hypothetical protein [Flavobacteriales bacterium]
RYLMPATLCFYIFLHLTNQRAKSVNVLLLLLCLVGLKNNYSYIDHYSARSKVYWDVLGLIKESDNRKVVLLMEPFQGREIVHATQLYLGNQFEVLECNIKNAETDKDTREVRKYYASLTTYKNAKIYDWHTFEDSLVDKSSSIMVGHPNEFSLLTKDLNQMTKIKEQRISRNYFELSLQNLIHGEFKYTNSVSRSVYSY